MRTTTQFDDNQGGTSQTPPYAERHFSVDEVAALWSLSDDSVRKMFEDEPGVLIIECQSSRTHKRRYKTLRIPEHVLERVHRRLSKV